MTSLVTPPNVTTTLTTSATYTDAVIQGPLVIQGPSITIEGAVSDSSYILVTTGGALRFNSSAATAGSIMMWGTGISIVFDAASAPGVTFAGSIGKVGIFTNPADDSSVTLSADAKVYGFHATDRLRFKSPAVSFTYVDLGPSEYQKPDVLTVTEADGTSIVVSLYTNFFTDQKASDLVLDNGSILFRSKQPPVITGTAAKQKVVTGQSILPFRGTVVTDPVAGQTETAKVKLSTFTGALIDPGAATDGSTWDASTGTFTVTGSASMVTQVLQGLVFAAKPFPLRGGQSIGTTATISVSGFRGDTGTDSTTTVFVGSGLSTSRNDLDGSGTSDLVWRRSDGLIVDWSMNGATVTSGSIVTSLDPSWTSLGSADLDGDGKTDLLWQRSDGLIVAWAMNGATVASGAILGTLDASWTLAARGDFDGDGRQDLMWRNTSGLIVEWQMNGLTVTAGRIVASTSPVITIIGSGDFNGDGKTDLLFRDDGGHVSAWCMDGSTPISTTNVALVDSSWTFLGAADFDGDGRADALWRQSGTGLIAEWQMGYPTGSIDPNAAGIIKSGPLATLDESWTFLGTGNFAGDGSAQVVWQSAAGQIVEWTISGFSVTGAATVGTLDASWAHIGA